jgi:hypothetical protein
VFALEEACDTDAGVQGAALHPASGMRQAIFRNILLAIECQPEEERQGHECDLERVHLFFALSDEPAHSPASCGGQSCGADGVEDFVAFFPEYFVHEGQLLSGNKASVYSGGSIYLHLTHHTQHFTPCAQCSLHVQSSGHIHAEYTSGLQGVPCDLQLHPSHFPEVHAMVALCTLASRCRICAGAITTDIMLLDDGGGSDDDDDGNNECFP